MNDTRESLALAEKRLALVTQRLNSHPVFTRIRTVEHLRTFMSWHVFPVWDFMSLLKRLQNDLSCTTVPWVPPKDIALARLVNDIVAAEETDQHPDTGTYSSHFDLYLSAMREVDASVAQAERFVSLVRASGGDYESALVQVGVPAPVAEFVRYTLSVAIDGETPEVLGSFFHGREKVIPDMFQAIVDNLGISPAECPIFHYYLERHIELDGDDHGPAAERMLHALYADSPAEMLKLLNCAVRSVEQRIALWDALAEELAVAALETAPLLLQAA